jgi:hypothetical protein
MTREFWFFGPVLLLSLGSIGAGVVALRPARELTAALPRWLVLALEYYVGQGVLTTLFLALGLAGRFSPAWLLPPLVAYAIVGVIGIATRWSHSVADARRAWLAWRAAPVAWKVVSVATAGLFLSGFSSVAGWLIVDAPAFYMAMARYIAGTGALTALPGYDLFSAVGLYGELQMAALFALGMDGTTPRVLSWVVCIPIIVVVYGLSRLCGLGRRGAVITIAVVVTSSSITSIWGSGKTDLFAIGPALAACVVVLALWDRDRLGPAPLIAGLLFGFAALAKLSYVVAFLPALTILMVWQRAHVRRPQGIVRLAAAAVPIGLMFSAGFLLAFGQNLVKNYLILGTPFANFPIAPVFSPATVRRIVLTYPLVLTYGRYWGQVGTLSPIVLAFLPLAAAYLRWPARSAESRLLALGLGAAAGLLIWVVLYPSIVMLRYFEATLLLLALPAAAAAEVATRRSTVLAWVVPAGILVTLAITPKHDVVPTFTSLHATLAMVAGPHQVCKGSAPFEADCHAEVEINQAVKPGDTVLGLSYVRFWLDPEIMRTMSTSDEIGWIRHCPNGPCPDDIFWARVRKMGFRFILHDALSHKLPPPPPDIELRRIYHAGNLSSYEILTR